MSKGVIAFILTLVLSGSALAAYLVTRDENAPPPPVIVTTPTASPIQSVDDLYRAENDLNNADVDADTTVPFSKAEQELRTQ